ncbi:transposase [Streptomyces goshikiensis]|uniref:transposase n=1 Tax=Streptomyces goshikiensis TaxID=1942 RepID=UPI003684CC30
MADKEEAATSVACDAMVDEAVERLLDKADASGAALLGEGGLLTEITRAVLERAPEAKMSEHLGYERGDLAGQGSGNSRNGTSRKTVPTDAGAVTLAMPRDRNGDFEPRLVPKNARRLAGFNDRILSLRARGMSVRDIRSHLAQVYGVEVGPDLIGKATDAVIDELATWQNRPLDLFAASDLGERYPAIVRTWRAAWPKFTPYLAFPPAMRTVVYSTNMVESMNAHLRKASRTGSASNDS